jgi:hypothetical protein
MAISTNTFTINAGYAKSDLLIQLESSFTWLGWHDKCDHTGIVTGIVEKGMYQLDPLATNNYFYEAEQYTSSGVGTDASFYMRRSGGYPYTVYVNRPGYGYTNGEYVSFLPGEASHESGSLGWGCTVYTNNTLSFGSTTAGFYDRDFESASSRNFGVLRHKIQDNKKYGVTYRIFQAENTTNIKFASGPFYYPNLDKGTARTQSYPPSLHHSSSSGPEYYPRLAGDYYLDVHGTPQTRELSPWDDDLHDQFSLKVSDSNSYQLDLNVYRSGIDPKFVVFSYKQPTLSSQDIIDNTFGTFILHNFTTDVWDLDNVFLGGVTLIFPEQTNEYYNPKLSIRTYCQSNNYPYTAKRCAEMPYDRRNDGVVSDYVCMLASGSPDNYIYDGDIRMYNRDSTYDVNQNTAGGVKSVSPDADYNAVIKGIPLNTMMLPCPYYMPDDFVLLNFDYGTPDANIQQGDTITISGSEVYTVITGNYTRTTRTRGILFCARTT